MSIQLNRTDFEGLGQVARHCNIEKLEIAINEAIQFDLKPLLCDIFFDVDTNWDDTDGIWFDIINPLEYEGCNERPKSHEGLKKVLTYYAYARYVLINNFDDTPNGGVNKTNEWSIPKPYNDLKTVSERYRNMGYDLWQEIEMYICLKKEVYPDANFANCAPCGCNGKCNSRTTNKGFGFKSSNISKRI